MFTILFWKETADRGIKSGLQAVILGLAVGEGFNIYGVDWQLASGIFLGAVALSVATSIISAPFGDKTTPTVIR